MPIEATDNDHQSAEKLSDYFGGRLPDYEMDRVEEHLSECLACSELASTVRAFGSVWEQWTASSHAEALAAERRTVLERLAESLGRVAAQAPAFEERIERWVTRVRQAVSQGALTATLPQVGAALELGAWELASFAAPVPAPGAVLTGGQGARAELRVPIGPEQLCAPVVLHDAATVIVEVALPASAAAPLAALTATDEDGPVRTQVLSFTADPPVWSARFHGVPPGSYLAAVEPF